ncbi:hypothetical protein [Chelativorans sp. YIM 93263]|uniref:hypothetical protein n=1 Tax=Chelativorans sp. YIM 93263 TaxID=2906648 RepID=UPI002379367C|nr:hypothetical protein [Chelativorans sp. YIM 93263]
MRLLARPGKRVGDPKILYSQPLTVENIEVRTTGEVVLTVLAADIYTPKATQRFSITFSPAEIHMICTAAKSQA